MKMPEKELLKSIRHMALSTVNEDGTPHNTPLFLIYNEDLTQLYWGSHPSSLHSKNIHRTGQGYVVVFDSKVWGQGGLYLTIKNAHMVTEDELPEALRVHNNARKRWGKDPLETSYYQEPNPQKMYVGDIDKIEVYNVVRDKDGLVCEETRKQIGPKDLLYG